MDFITIIGISAISLLFLIFGGSIIYNSISDCDIIGAIVGTIIILVVVLSLGYMAYESNQKKEAELITEQVTVEIVNKEYSPTWTQAVLVGKVTTLIVHPEQYDVTMSDEDKNTQIFDDKGLYDSLEVGDKIIVTRNTWIIGDGEIYKIEFEIKNKED